MKTGKVSFFTAFVTLFSRILSGRVQFKKDLKGKLLKMEDGKAFHIIRDLKISTEKELEKSAAVFKVRFKFSGLPIKINKRMSAFPTPFLIAKPEFIEKIWTFSGDETFQGIYQFASKEEADSYPESFIFKLMTKRSAEGTLSYEVLPGTSLSEYAESLLK